MARVVDPNETSETERSESDKSETRDRWIATVTVALLVFLPVLGGRILGPGWPHPATSATEDAPSVDPVESPKEESEAPIEGEVDFDPDAPWVFAAAGEVWAQPVSQPVPRLGSQRDAILVGSDDGTAYALDAASGRLLWTLTTRGAIRSRAAAAGDLRFWTSADGHVYAADATSGETRWRARAAATSGPAADAGRVVVGTADGLVALDAGSGRIAWRAEIGAVPAAPTLTGQQVLAGTSKGSLVAIDARTGRRQWTFETGAEISTSPAVADRLVLVTAGDGTVYCLDAETGRERWRSGTSEFVGSAPAVSNGRVFVGGGDGALWAFDLESGQGLWRRRLAEAVRGTPFADGDTLWMAAGERYLAAVRAADGEPLHVFAVDGWVSASPLVVAPEVGPERLVFATADGSVHGVPLRLVTEELALRPQVDTDSANEARLVIEPTFHDGAPEILWQTTLPGRPAAAPAPAAGRLVVGAGRYVVALDRESGDEIWRVQGEGSFDTTPIVVGSRTLATRRAGQSGRGALVALDLYDGRQLWRTEVDDDATTSPAVWRGRAIFGTAGARVVAVGLEDGAVIWSHATDATGAGGVMTGGPAVAGGQGFGIVIAGGCDGVVYGLSADDGRELWQYRAEDCVATDAVLAPSSGQEVVYLADAAGHVYALDPAVGGEVWRASLGGAAARRPLIHGGTLYLGSHDGNLWALSALHGGTGWRFDARGPVTGTVALDFGIAYAASTDGALHAVGAINGQEFWRLEIPAPAYDVAFDDGVVFVVTGGATGGRIYALRVP